HRRSLISLPVSRKSSPQRTRRTHRIHGLRVITNGQATGGRQRRPQYFESDPRFAKTLALSQQPIPVNSAMPVRFCNFKDLRERRTGRERGRRLLAQTAAFSLSATSPQELQVYDAEGLAKSGWPS